MSLGPISKDIIGLTIHVGSYDSERLSFLIDIIIILFFNSCGYTGNMDIELN